MPGKQPPPATASSAPANDRAEAEVRPARAPLSQLSRSSHPLASGSNTAAQPQMQERRLFVLADSARSQQTPAEGREITDRLLTIESGTSS